jgi:hypothetical protein
VSSRGAWPATGAGVKGRQPLRALGIHRRFPGGLLFGMNLIPDIPAGESGLIRVGDEVSVLP